MIKISKHDSIVDIIIKMNQSKEKEIILEFPFGHPILHNYTSLRILKNNAGKKDLIIITSDLAAKKIGKKLGIKYSLIKNYDLLEYNYTFSEYFKFLIKNYFQEFKSFIFHGRSGRTLIEYKKHFRGHQSRVGYFIFGFIISIFLLIFIFYFAVNKTYIYITPEIDIKTRAKNFVFQEVKDEASMLSPNVIKLKNIQKLIYLNETFGTSGVNEGTIKRSKGEVLMINELPEKIRLRPKTRLRNKEGIIYTIESSVDIPAAIKNTSGELIPGTKKVLIQSAIHDEKGKIAGTRSNIEKDVFLDLPGLTTNQDKIYAKTITKIKGGDDNFEKLLSEDDIKNSKILFESKIKELALKELKEEVNIANNTNNISYDILPIDGIIEYTNFEITGLDNLIVGEKRENFKLSGTINISTYTYNKDLLLSKLKASIKENILKEVENISLINNNSLRIAAVLEEQSNPIYIKATAEVEVFFSRNFLNKTDGYVEKLKSTIAGLKKEEATNILLNNPKISDVKIETRPFFIKNITSLPENIEFEVVNK